MRTGAQRNPATCLRQLEKTVLSPCVGWWLTRACFVSARHRAGVAPGNTLTGAQVVACFPTGPTTASQKRRRTLPDAALPLGRRQNSREGHVGWVAGAGRHFTRKPCFTRQPSSPTNPAKEALHQSVVPWGGEEVVGARTLGSYAARMRCHDTARCLPTCGGCGGGRRT